MQSAEPSVNHSSNIKDHWSQIVITNNNNNDINNNNKV